MSTPGTYQPGREVANRAAVLGMIWPDTGDALDLFEMATSARLNAVAACDGISFDVGYSQGPAGHGIGALQHVGKVHSIARAGSDLVDQGADAVVWACTSGSFIGGLQWARNQQHELEDQIGRPVTSGTLALITSARRLEAKYLDILSPYPPDVSAIFHECITDAGFEVSALRPLHSPDATASAALPLAEECRRFSTSKGDIVVIPDTAANTLSLISELEAAAEKPVLTVNQACVFEGAALIGMEERLSAISAFQRLANSVEGRTP